MRKPVFPDSTTMHVELSEDDKMAVDGVNSPTDLGYGALELIIVRELVEREGVPMQRVPELCLAVAEATGRGQVWAQSCVWGLILGATYPKAPDKRPVDALELRVDEDHPAVADFVESLE